MPRMGFTRSALTRFGRYRYLRMSFQINLAPEEFKSNIQIMSMMSTERSR